MTSNQAHLRAVPQPANHNHPQRQKLYLYTENLSLYYAEQAAFMDISLPVCQGKITALIGPSGCGKTSFIQSIIRMHELTPYARIAGKVYKHGQNILDKGLDLVQLRKRIGLIFQRPTPFPFSIRKNFSLPLKEHGMKRHDEIEHMMETALKDVGLWGEVNGRLEHPATTLSGGQQQRLCIARALALRPEALLLDEPCSALDPHSSRAVEELIEGLKERYTLIMVTHNLAQAKRIADLTAFFWLQENAGRLIEYGSTEQIFKNPQHALTQAYVQGRSG